MKSIHLFESIVEMEYCHSHACENMTCAKKKFRKLIWDFQASRALIEIYYTNKSLLNP